MAIESVYGFPADNEDIVFYNRKSVRNLAIQYFSDEDQTILFDFPGYSSSYLYVYDSEERTRLVKSFTTQVTRSSSYQILNLSVLDMTFEDDGKYYYELGFVQSGYEVPLRYGVMEII